MMKTSGDDHGHRIFFENEYIKVFETFLQPGEKLSMHSHKPHLRYCFTPGVNIHTWEDGTVQTTIDKPGDYEWRNTLVHAVENGGNCVIHSLIFELKRDFISFMQKEEQQLIKNITAFIQTSDLNKIYHLRKLIADNSLVRIYEVDMESSVVNIWRPNTLIFGQLKPNQTVIIESILDNDKKVLLRNQEPQWIKSGYYKILSNSPAVILFFELFETLIRSSL